jgi:uncharacterized tellurite resistance protein B-like protein
MRGNFLVTIGILLIVGGAIVLFVGYSSGNAAWAAIAWAAIIGGTLALLGGIARKVSSFMEQKPNNNSDYAHAEIRTLIKSMGEMAVADGVIDPREVATIANVHERMLGITISTNEVAEILSEFDEKDDMAKTLEADRKMVNPAMKRMIIQSCYLVMVADGHKAGVELSRLLEIGDALGISKTEVEHLISIAAS